MGQLNAQAQEVHGCFLKGGGETGSIFRSINWANSPLGPVSKWPPALIISLNVLFHSKHPMVIFWGPELIQFYNDAYMPSLGAEKHARGIGSRAQDFWREIWDIIHPQIQSVMLRGESTWYENGLFPYSRNGKIENVYWTYGYSPILNLDGSIGGVMVICNETTAGVEAERALTSERARIDEAKAKEERLNQEMSSALSARDNFLSIASHELKTPITGMKLQLQLLERNIGKKDPQAFNPERITKLVKQTTLGLNRMTRVVDDMLDISRIDGGKVTLHFETTDLFTFTREVIDRFAEELLGVGIKIALTAKVENIRVTLDRFRMEQVLTNLITNAIRYAPYAPISITLDRRKNGTICIIFQDGGPGIKEENWDRVFQRFERLGSANDVSGLGLGLFIVRQMVQAHGGKIYLEKSKSHGAKFVIELPQ